MALSQSKIFVIHTNINKRLAMKFTEAMACGTMVLSDEPEDFAMQGFKNNHHLVLYDGLGDMKDKLLYYLRNDSERNLIATQGMNFVRSEHSCSKRIRQFTKIVKRELNI
jgi:spore maturation protein CgeB